MNSRLNIPVAISYVKKSDILSYTSSLAGSCKVQVLEWITIPFVKGSVNFEFNQKKVAAGELCTTELTTNTRETFTEKSPVIVRLDFEDSETLIIGSPELPVTISGEYNLTSKKLKFSHKNWHKPLKLVS